MVTLVTIDVYRTATMMALVAQTAQPPKWPKLSKWPELPKRPELP